MDTENIQDPRVGREGDCGATTNMTSGREYICIIKKHSSYVPHFMIKRWLGPKV